MRTPNTPLNLTTAILRLSVGVRRDPALDVWLDERPVALGSIARRWFAQMRQCGPDFKDHANVGFFQGADLVDPARLLEGSGKRMRHVKVKPNAALDSEALAVLISDAYADIKERLDQERFIAGARG
jgi:hypothetical protein